MSWSYRKKDGVWVCTSYSDLNYNEINNLAEYGQPKSPYQPGFVAGFVPDFAKVAVEMPQQEVMTKGYGKDITATSFDVVKRFLARADVPAFGGFFGGAALPQGNLTFDDLVTRKFAKEADRTLVGSLYPFPFAWSQLPAGTIDAGDAAYIHGSVAFALMKDTRFVNTGTGRRVDAEIGARSDNWDFESSNKLAQAANSVVAAVLGPDHYNLTKPIRLLFSGPGKRSSAKS